jgi:hypothetical protein
MLNKCSLLSHMLAARPHIQLNTLTHSKYATICYFSSITTIYQQKKANYYLTLLVHTTLSANLQPIYLLAYIHHTVRSVNFHQTPNYNCNCKQWR